MTAHIREPEGRELLLRVLRASTRLDPRVEARALPGRAWWAVNWNPAGVRVRHAR